MHFQTLKTIDLKNKTVLLRVDLNVPRQDDHVTDTTRIDRLKPTVSYLQEQGAKIVILSHFGRPKGVPDPALSLAFLVPVLEQCWGVSVRFSPETIGNQAKETVASAPQGDVILLENVRFYDGEKSNDPAFAQSLAALGDLYVNDAFSVSHRAHASTTGIAAFLPSAAGLLMEEELNALTHALEKPERPVLAVTGGSKISTKLGVLQNLIEKVDYLVLGGGMANTFLYAQDVSMGKSLCEKDMVDTARDIMEKAEKIGCDIILPKDVVIVRELKENAPSDTVRIKDIPDDGMAIDIGPETIKYISEKVKSSKTVVWNGPMGVFEVKPFDHGTNKVAEIVVNQTKLGRCTSVAGGGDTIAALENAGVSSDFSYLSTAGGAFLEWLEGKNIPGVKALTQK